MRSLLLLVAATSVAHADLDPWSVDIGYRATGSLVAVGDVSNVYTDSLLARIEWTTGRWFVGTVLATPLPGAIGQFESSIGGGVHHVLREGTCLRGPTTRLYCGHALVLDYAIETGVAGLVRFDERRDRRIEYYGPLVRPRTTLRMLWPTRGGNQIGVSATVGVAAVAALAGVITKPAPMTTDDAPNTFRIEPSLEIGGVYRF